jgi:hypothetical protein
MLSFTSVSLSASHLLADRAGGLPQFGCTDKTMVVAEARRQARGGGFCSGFAALFLDCPGPTGRHCPKTRGPSEGTGEKGGVA